MELALFEDDAWANFVPVSSTRHLAQQLFGTSTILNRVREKVKGAQVSLVGRDYLAALERRRTGLPYNETDGRALLVNARVNPLANLEKTASIGRDDVVVHKGDVVAIWLRSSEVEKARTPDGSLSRSAMITLAKGMKKVEGSTGDLFDYPWEVLEANDEAIRDSARRNRRKLIIDPDATVEEFVSFDTREGPVIIDEGAQVEAFSRISGPAYIGKECVLHSALVRPGTTLGEGCKVGGEVDHSIVYRRSNKAHFGYLGHSIVGEWVNIGAGAVTSDLKNTYGTVRVSIQGSRVDTGLVKMGSLIGDMAKISIGTMLYGGKQVGVAARAAGIVDRDIPDFTGQSSDSTQTRLELEQVILTQTRMKARRNETFSRQERGVIEHLYASGSGKR